MKNDDLFIRNYFNQLLEEKDIIAFEKRYMEEPEFRVLADQIEVEVLGIRAQSREELNMKFQSWDKENELKGKVNSRLKIRRYIQMGVAASILLVLGVFFNMPTSNQDLFDQYYKPFPNYLAPITRSNEQGDEHNLKVLGLQRYEQGDYKQAEIHLKKYLDDNKHDRGIILYLGLAMLGNNKASDAISILEQSVAMNDTLYRDVAQWYLALAYIQNKNNDKARDVFENLSKTESSYQDEARDLLENW